MPWNDMTWPTSNTSITDHLNFKSYSAIQWMFIHSYRALGDKSLKIFGQHITSFIQIYHRCFIQWKRKTEMDHISWIFSYYYSGSTPSEKSNQIVDHLQCRLKISLISLPLHEQVFFFPFLFASRCCDFCLSVSDPWLFWMLRSISRSHDSWSPSLLLSKM